MSSAAAPRGTLEHVNPLVIAGGLVLLFVIGGGMIAGSAGARGIGALPDGVLAALVMLGFGVVCGYAPVKLLVPEEMNGSVPLLVPLAGVCAGGLELTVLAFVGFSLDAALAIVLAGSAVAAVVARIRVGPLPRGAYEGGLLGIVVPALIACALMFTLLSPIARDDFAGVPGENPDAMLGVGVVELLSEAGPRDNRPELPTDSMPEVWRSKYPIYYATAATSELSGLGPVGSWAGVSAVLAALTALGFMLFARYGLCASALAALLALAFLCANRTIGHLAVHPYFNQLWGTLAFGPMLLFGLRFVRKPNRGYGGLFALFGAVGILAYPLMVLFPALFLGTAWWTARREDTGLGALRFKLRGTGARRWQVIVGGVIAVPAALVLLAGAIEKMDSTDVILPGKPLDAWRGDLTFWRDPDFFFGADNFLGWAAAAAIVVLALAYTRRLPPIVRRPMQATIVAALAFVLYFRLRTFGEYLHFKLLAFLAPLLLVAAACELAAYIFGPDKRRAIAAGVAALTLIIVMGDGLRAELKTTGQQANEEIDQLEEAAKQLPPGASVRLDLEGGRQLWAGWALADHPTTALVPIIGTTYPSPPQGRKADFIVDDAAEFIPPADAIGRPVYANKAYRLWRMDPAVPGPDRASQAYAPGLGGYVR